MKKIFALLVALALAVVGSLFVGVLPANAAADGYQTYSRKFMDTAFCTCFHSDPYDGAYFEKDRGGTAARILIRNGDGDFAGKVEFHPNGEILYVYDRLNDSRSINVIVYNGNGRSWFDYVEVGQMKTTVRDWALPEGKVLYLTIRTGGDSIDYKIPVRT